MRIVDGEKTTTSVPGFCDEIAEESGQNIEACYQCGKCTAGCPMACDMDRMPSQVIRLVQLGLRDEALGSGAIWHCAGCETCASRCPRDIDMARVMKALARRAYKEGVKPKDPSVMNLHKAFVESMARWGRAHELELMSLTKARTPSQMLKDIPLGAALFTKGKLSILPHWVRASRKVWEIVNRDRISEESQETQSNPEDDASQ